MKTGSNGWSSIIFLGILPFFWVLAMAETITLDVVGVGKLTIPNTSDAARDVLQFARAAVKQGFNSMKNHDRLLKIYSHFCERRKCSRELPEQLSIGGTRPQVWIEPWDEPAEVLEHYMMERFNRGEEITDAQVSVVSALLDQICTVTICFRGTLQLPKKVYKQQGLSTANHLTAGVSAHQCPELQHKEFVMYSYNFGNYRNELLVVEKWLKKLSLHGIDGYFFTDDLSFNPSIPNWQIVHMNASEEVNGIPASRVSSKHLKFYGHSRLSKYRYWIHVDSHPERMRLLNEWLTNGLTYFVKAHPNHILYITKHYLRDSVQEEVETLKLNANAHLQPRSSLEMWDSYLKPIYSRVNKVRLVGTDIWVRDTLGSDFARLWGKIYDTLLERALWRDQIVYPVVMENASSLVYLVDRSDPSTFWSSCADNHAHNNEEPILKKNLIMTELFGEDLASPYSKGARVYPVGSKEDTRCMELAVRKVGSMRSLNKVRGSLKIARLASKAPGDFAEAGVAEGGGALAVLFYLACSGNLADRKFHLFDSWEGIPAPVSRFDAGFEKGMWHVPYERFMRNVDIWGQYYNRFRMEFFTWKEAISHITIHRGLFADTMPSALANRKVVALYCDGDMYESSMDCMETASQSLEAGSWIYQDDYYTFHGSYMATNDWRKKSEFQHGPIHLVANTNKWELFQEGSANCIPPQFNVKRKGRTKHVQSGSCNSAKVEAGFWKLEPKNGLPNIFAKYEAYKFHIDTKMQNYLSCGTPCQELPLYAGEFGYELVGIVPWYYDVHISEQCDLHVTGVVGTRYLYWFASSFTESLTKRGARKLPLFGPLNSTDIHVKSLPDKGWTAPPWKVFFGDGPNIPDLFPSKRPLFLVFNKYTTEWRGPPVNFLDMKTLSRLFELMTPSFQVVYVRMESRLLSDVHQSYVSFNDKPMIREQFPSVLVFDDLFDEMTMDYNLLLFAIASRCKMFVSVNGGTSIIASLWGGKNFVYAARGGELKYNSFVSWYGQLGGGTQVWNTDDRQVLVDMVRKEIDSYSHQ